MNDQKICLVIEDSELIREIALRILTGYGLKAEGAATAAEAVDFCAEHKPAAVFLDWDLPSMGALDFLRAMAAEKKTSIAGEGPAIVLCATENDPQQFTLAKAAGAAHHILKPFDKTMVGAKLAEIGLIDGGELLSAQVASR